MDNKPSYDELAIAVRGYEEECFALKAHVERLRGEAANQRLEYKRRCMEQVMRVKYEVEEETIERCAKYVDHIDNDGIRMINNIPRKYSNQPETAEKDGE